MSIAEGIMKSVVTIGTTIIDNDKVENRLAATVAICAGLAVAGVIGIAGYVAHKVVGNEKILKKVAKRLTRHEKTLTTEK
jgi:heme exporter protein D